MSTVTLPIAADHAAFAGHFPGNPIVPGVVLLDECLHSIATVCGVSIAQCTIVSAKFLSAAHPGELLRLDFEPAESDRVNFTIRTPDRIVASGVLSIPATVARSNAG